MPACSARFPESASVALVEASVRVKAGDLAAADKVLTGLQSGNPTMNLQAVLLRAQLAVSNNEQTQVSLIINDNNNNDHR